MNRYEQSMRQRSYRHHHQNSARDYSPSFSSSLLDAIYRSFDESSTDHHKPKTSHDKEENEFQQFSAKKTRSAGKESKSSSRARLIHQWIQKTAENDILRRISALDHRSDDTSKTSLKTDSRFQGPKLMNSSSSSSVSSGVFSSSSESEPFHRSSLKPIRTSLNHQPPQISQFSSDHQIPKKNDQIHTTTTTTTRTTTSAEAKSRAMTKIYANLKKSKQNPISPGAKLASFLNTLFNSKKPKISSPPINEATKSEKDLKSPANSSSSTCSTASSISRSCLNKTPSSAGKTEQQQTGKRSVRFCPVSETVTEYYTKPDTMEVYVDDEFRTRIMEEGRKRIEEAARELLEKYRHEDEDEDEDEDDDDDRSCCSSDLFELENLMEIGIERYREELPVYGTTRLDIGNGIVV